MHGLRELVLRIAKTFAGNASGDDAADVADAAVRIGRIAIDPQQQAVLTTLLGWLASVHEAAPAKWYHPDAPHTCDVPLRNGPCRNAAVGRCVVCGRDVCLMHAAVSMHADLICATCCAYAKAHLGQRREAREAPPNAWDPASGARRPPDAQPTDEQLLEAYRILGIHPGASIEEVERRVRELRVKHHPDRKKTAKEKAAAEARFKRVGEAYDLIARARTSK